jgi:DNA-binding MarR family transcriptional regulator
LSALLSQTLVAFTIELDNEADHQTPHRTSDYGSTGGSSGDSRGAPWLTSAAMYFNCLKYVPEEGISLGGLYERARTKTNIGGMLRWGYVTMEPRPSPGKPAKADLDSVIRATRAGRKSQEIWKALVPQVEDRWRERFGADPFGALRHSLEETVKQFTLDLPDCMPILGYGLLGKEEFRRREGAVDFSDAALLTLLSQVLLTYSIQYETRSPVSLAIGANVLRVVEKDGVRIRDLPALSGVSKEAIAMAAGFLERQGFAIKEPLPSPSRGDLFCLTARGLEAREQYFSLTAAIDERWPAHFGEGVSQELRASLELLVGYGSSRTSPLFKGLTPYPEGWRAKVRMPSTMPHFPMVLHRGGYPDGS